jgi:SAM-dependent methyltransferase
VGARCERGPLRRVAACATSVGVNKEQIEFWNGPGAARWTVHQVALDRALRTFGEAAIARALVQPGERVLDVGCGCGDSTLSLAGRVGPAGSVTGVDVSAPLLARARQRAAGLEHVQFIQADAAELALPADIDLIFSRFGVMFFNEPVAAFKQLRATLRGGGRVAFVCWRPFSDNPWASVPFEAILEEYPDAEPNDGKDAAGPFAFADRARLEHVLCAAGFGPFQIERFDDQLTMSEGSLSDAVDFALNTGPVARLLVDASPEALARVRERMARALAPHHTATGVSLAGSVWLVTAVKGDGSR